MAVYDSAKIRTVATEIKRIARAVDGDVRTGLRTASAYCDEFSGKTSRAMEEKLEGLLHMAEDIEDELSDLARRIGAYADMLELADKQLAEKL